MPHEIKSKIRTIPNWPKDGIMFRDITTLLKDPKGMRKVVDLLVHRYSGEQFDKIAAIESRGFIIGGALAHQLGKGLILLRKKGKLPAETVSHEYELEYGTDTIEVHKDAIQPGDKVLIVDDLVATAGTACAACALIEKLGGNVYECAFIVDLPDVGGSKKLKQKGYNVYCMVEFEGD